MPMMWYGYSWGSVLIVLLNMVFWAAIIGLPVWAVGRWLITRTLASGPTGPAAMEILRQRYARGEIDATTFKQMRAQLEHSTLPREPASIS